MVDKIINFFGAIMLALVTIIVFVEVFLRYLFSAPIPGSSAAVLLLFPWFIFLVAIIVTKNDDNLGVEFFRNQMPKTIQFILKTLEEIVCLIFFAIMLLSSYKLVSDTLYRRMPMFDISRAWLYGSMLVMFAVLVIHQIYRIYSYVIVFVNKLKDNNN